MTYLEVFRRYQAVANRARREYLAQVDFRRYFGRYQFRSGTTSGIKRLSSPASLAFVLILIASRIASAQEATQPAASPSGEHRSDGVKFLGGAVLGLVFHESGHLVVDLALNARPRLKRVDLAGAPFFAILPRSDLSTRRKLMASAAGFWAQNLTSERLLTMHPSLRAEHAPFTKGEFAFEELLAMGYGTAAMANAGKPGDRSMDTRAMADATGIRQPIIGALVLAPAALDAWRYFKPNARWATWTSRAFKAGALLLVLK